MTFFTETITGILSKEDVNGNGALKNDQYPEDEGGHACVISSYHLARKYYKIKNSWGCGFADQGYFRVHKDALPFKFCDLYYRIIDLTSEDHKRFKTY